jgi:hypothetical protein
MKVRIGKYPNWLSFWHLIDPLQKVGVSEDRTDAIAEYLSETWIQKVVDWINTFHTKQTVKVRIDKWDTWGMDNTLAHIIVPMLKQLKATKHGSPYVDDEDVPDHMRHTWVKGDDDYETNDPWVHYKWEWVLNEMIWAFEQIIDENGEEQFYHGKPEYVRTLIEDSEEVLYNLEQTNPDYWVDYEGIKAYNDRIQNGTRLFGRYYRNLWD